MKQVTVNIIDDREFDEIVSKHYPGKSGYTILNDPEWYNDSEHLFDITRQKLVAYDKERLFSAPDLVLTDLCNKGIIQEGYYLLTLGW